MAISVQQLYGEIWGAECPELEARLNTSLSPRSSRMLYERFGALGVSDSDTVLDAGCRDAHHAIELVKRFGCHVVAIDPIPLHIANAKASVHSAGQDDRVTVLEASIEDLPLPSSSLPYIWCRDVLNHVPLSEGLAECFRVLEPGGVMLVYQTFKTPLCEPNEAQRLWEAMSIVPSNMEPSYFEKTASQSGFVIREVDKVDSEWRENWLEGGDTSLMEDLLKVARMRRTEDPLVEAYGRTRYEAEYTGCLWGIYQMLGKLCPTIYVLKKPDEMIGA